MDGRGLLKRHSFPLQTYTWNSMIQGPARLDEEIRIPKVNAPVINSEGTHEEREARLEAAILWIRKELADMRHQDKFLTRQFIQLRTTIQRLKNENNMLEEMQTSASSNGEIESDNLGDLSPRKVVPRARDGRPLLRKSYSMVV